MLKLLVLADDLTGALDTGAQFAMQQIRALVTETEGVLPDAISSALQVLVMNLNTRHMPKEGAYARVYEVATRARKAGVDLIYKKTDSGLRGNIGAELHALMDAKDGQSIAFVPAFPRIGRTVKEGILYIDGIPVSQSIFSQDLFNPVRYDTIADIIRQQSDVEVLVIPEGQMPCAEDASGKILVFDAQTDAHITRIVTGLSQGLVPIQLAGCAGFAKHLKSYASLKSDAPCRRLIGKQLLFASASTSDIHFAQVGQAREEGWPLIQLSPVLQLAEDITILPEGRKVVQRAIADMRRHGRLMLLATTDAESVAETVHLAKASGLSLEESADRIVRNVAALVRAVHLETDCVLVISGGDTLRAVLRAISLQWIEPIEELIPGVVYACARSEARQVEIISKSGSFGPPDALQQIQQYIGSAHTACGRG